MFDIGFWELTMIGVVALLVIGPERLPKVARVGGFWLGKARGYVSSMKQELDKELQMDELKKNIQAETPIDEVKEVSESLRQTTDQLRELANSPELEKNNSENKDG